MTSQRGHPLSAALRNHAWLLGDRLVRAVVGVVVLAVMARSLGPAGYGLYAFAAAIVGFFSLLGANGLDGLVVREIVRDPAREQQLLAAAFGLRLAGAAGALVSSLVAVRVAGPTGDAALLTLLLGLSYAFIVFDTADLWLQARVLSRVMVIGKGLSFLLFAMVRLLLALNEAPVEWFALAALGESALGAALLLAGARRAGLETRWLRPTLAALPALLREGWPACLAVVMIAARSRIDQILLGRLAGFDETAAYAIAMRFSELWLVVPGTLMASLFPAIVRARESDPAAYRRRLQTLCDALVWIAALAAILVTVVGPALLEGLFGVAFARAGQVVVVLFWWAAWVFFATARTRWLVADGRIMPILAVEALGLVTAVVANLALVPTYAALGAAYAAVVSAILSNLAVAVFSCPIRESLRMFVISLAAPVRILALRRR